MKYSHAVTDESASPGSKNAGNLEFGAAHVLPYEILLAGVVGYKRIPDEDSIVHWKVGVSYTFQQAYGIAVGLDAVGNNATFDGTGKHPHKTAPVVYVTKTLAF